MKILWITNMLFPDVCKTLGIDSPVVGGWMYASAKALLNTNPTIQLSVASLYSGKEFTSMDLNGITYYLLPRTGSNTSYEPSYEKYWKIVKESFTPDVVHLHGTEYPHGLSYITACGNENLVVSIQGLVSVYERYYYGGIPKVDLWKNITFRDLLKRDTIFNQHSIMTHRGQFERQILKSVHHVVGRTSWDKAHAWACNHTIQYHFGNETLREEFYKHQWAFETCEKQSIFLSQAHYPIKGLHQMIHALPFILPHFPNVKVYVAGNDFVNKATWRMGGYGKFIQSILKKYKLEKHVVFTGILSEQQICQRFLQSNVFVCPSSIENSPNSVGEAQLLGVPCIASFVGGMIDFIDHNESGLLYRFEEVEMLAKSICLLFSDQKLAEKIATNGRIAAITRHDKKINANRINEIYATICKRELR